jgi:hypothetical protein
LVLKGAPPRDFVGKEFIHSIDRLLKEVAFLIQVFILILGFKKLYFGKAVLDNSPIRALLVIFLLVDLTKVI